MFLRGFLLSISAYFIWGLAPIFWKLAGHIPTTILLYHRVIVACLLLFLFILPRMKTELPQIKVNWRYFILTSVLIGANWFTFVWAIVNDRILETSLGYYLNPFLNLMVGYVLLNERLTKNQVFAVIVAFFGVCFITYSVGYLPWVSLLLACTFSFYGYTHKKMTMRGDSSLFVETLYLLPIFLFLNFRDPQVYEVYKDPMNFVYLFFTGLITVVPLIFFIQGVKKIPLGLTGILQFMAPSMTFCLAIFLYNEPFTYSQLIGFAFIWTAIVFYVIEAFRKRRRQKKQDLNNKAKA